jgi:hypothetical protein
VYLALLDWYWYQTPLGAGMPFLDNDTCTEPGVIYFCQGFLPCMMPSMDGWTGHVMKRASGCNSGPREHDFMDNSTVIWVILFVQKKFTTMMMPNHSHTIMIHHFLSTHNVISMTWNKSHTPNMSFTNWLYSGYLSLFF